MADDSMSLLGQLRKASADGDVDLLREGVRLLAQAIMEAEVSELTGVRQGRARSRAPPDPPQRVSRPALGHPGRHDRPRVPRVRDGSLLPEPPRAAAAGRAGPARGRPGGVRVGGLHPPGRRPRAGPGHRGDQPQRGEPDLCGPRRRGRGVPDPLARRDRLPLPLARRDVPQGPRGRPGRLDGGPRRGRGRRSPGSAGCSASSSAPATTRAAPGPAFIRSLVERGLHGVRLVISDDHPGLVKAIREQLLGSALAALPGPLHPQCPGPRAPRRPEHGRLGDPLGLRAARRASPPGSSSTGSSTACAAVRQGRRPARRR